MRSLRLSHNNFIISTLKTNDLSFAYVFPLLPSHTSFLMSPNYSIFSPFYPFTYSPNQLKYYICTYY